MLLIGPLLAMNSLLGKSTANGLKETILSSSMSTGRMNIPSGSGSRSSTRYCCAASSRGTAVSNSLSVMVASSSICVSDSLSSSSLNK